MMMARDVNLRTWLIGVAPPTPDIMLKEKISEHLEIRRFTDPEEMRDFLANICAGWAECWADAVLKRLGKLCIHHPK
jgi:hypothetical protein